MFNLSLALFLISPTLSISKSLLIPTSPLFLIYHDLISVISFFFPLHCSLSFIHTAGVTLLHYTLVSSRLSSHMSSKHRYMQIRSLGHKASFSHVSH